MVQWKAWHMVGMVPCKKNETQIGIDTPCQSILGLSDVCSLFGNTPETHNPNHTYIFCEWFFCTWWNMQNKRPKPNRTTPLACDFHMLHLHRTQKGSDKCILHHLRDKRKRLQDNRISRWFLSWKSWFCKNQGLGTQCHLILHTKKNPNDLILSQNHMESLYHDGIILWTRRRLARERKKVMLQQP